MMKSHSYYFYHYCQRCRNHLFTGRFLHHDHSPRPPSFLRSRRQRSHPVNTSLSSRLSFSSWPSSSFAAAATDDNDHDDNDDDGDSNNHNHLEKVTTIHTEKEGPIPPLFRFESAKLRYPTPSLLLPRNATAPPHGHDVHWDDGLEQDHLDLDRNLDEYEELLRESTSESSPSFDLNIWPNLECGSGGGGHVVLGRNGAGKTLLSRALVHAGDEMDLSSVDDSFDGDVNPYLRSGTLQKTRSISHSSKPRNRTHRFLSHVSFESHSNLLLQRYTTKQQPQHSPHPQSQPQHEQDNSLTVHRALIPTGGNRLSPTAKFLAVRLGMFPLLPRRISSLSTGEIRRVLLVRALVSKPSLLILDNAFDGLDVEGRKGLEDIVERVLRGFRMDILVEGVGDGRDDVGRTQVMLLTHRPEEVVGGMGRVSFVMDGTGGLGTHGSGSGSGIALGSQGVRVKTVDRQGRSGHELVHALKYWQDGDLDDEELERAMAGGALVGTRDGLSAESRPWEIISDDDFPGDADIRDFWYHDRHGSSRDDVLVRADHLQVTREDTVLLSDLTWTVHRGERWHLAGTNGTGKSTLSRLLVRWSVFDADRNGDSLTEGISFNGNKHDSVVSDGSLFVTPSAAGKGVSNRGRGGGGVGWVSTELHLHAAHNWGARTVLDILTVGIVPHNNVDTNKPAEGVDMDLAITAATWLGLLHRSTSTSTSTSTNIDLNKHPFLKRTFDSLSQGQQKLLLIASAIARRPSLLVLDEPCQGLDLWNRGHVLGLVERICRVTDMSLVYVTHHNEELIPAITKRLSLEDGRSVHCGPIDL